MVILNINVRREYFTVLYNNLLSWHRPRYLIYKAYRLIRILINPSSIVFTVLFELVPFQIDFRIDFKDLSVQIKRDLFYFPISRPVTVPLFPTDCRFVQKTFVTKNKPTRRNVIQYRIYNFHRHSPLIAIIVNRSKLV